MTSSENTQQSSPIPVFSELPLMAGRNYKEHLRIKAERAVQIEAFDLALRIDDPEAVATFKQRIETLTPYALGELTAMLRETYFAGVIGWESDPHSDDPAAKRGIYAALADPEKQYPAEIIAENGFPMRIVRGSADSAQSEYGRALAHGNAIGAILSGLYIDYSTSVDGRLDQYALGDRAAYCSIDPGYYMRTK